MQDFGTIALMTILIPAGMWIISFSVKHLVASLGGGQAKLEVTIKELQVTIEHLRSQNEALHREIIRYSVFVENLQKEVEGLRSIRSEIDTIKGIINRERR